MTAYDAIVIGTGQAGPYVTSRLAGAGMKVAVIERSAFGGTCVNTGCIPTKTMVASAFRRAEAAHGKYETRIGKGRDENWSEWYAAYMVAEQSGRELPS